MQPQLAAANLFAAVTALGAARARPFLVDGTLLGAVREGGFMAHDLDIDLGVMVEDLSADLSRRMLAAGFTLHRSYGHATRGLQFSWKRHGIKVDTFFYYRDTQNGDLFHAAWLEGQPIRYSYPAFQLAPLRFLDRDFLAPLPPEAFLARKYGPEWRTPVTPWDWAWGPKNASAWVDA